MTPEVILLDAGIPVKLADYFTELYLAVSVHTLGWSNLRNGNLLRAMKDEGYRFLVSNDRRMQDQQNRQKITEANITVVSFKSYRITIDRLKYGVPEVLEIISGPAKPGFYLVDIDEIINQL